MLRARFALPFLLATFAVWGAGAACASAYVYLIEGGELKTTEKLESSGLNEEFGLKGKIAGVTLQVGCAKGTTTGTLEPAGRSTSEVKLTACSLYEIKSGKKELLSSCKVAEPLTLKLIGELYTASNEDLFLESPANIGIEGVFCSFHGSYALIGGQECSIPEAKVEKKVHEVKCAFTESESESGLEVAGSMASLMYSHNLSLSSGKGMDVGGVQPARPTLVWKVAGAELKSGSSPEKRTITSLLAEENITFEGNHNGTAYSVVCTTAGAAAGTTPMISAPFGPTNFPGFLIVTLKFGGCKIQPAGLAAKCKVKGEAIKSGDLLNELVEGVAASSGKEMVVFQAEAGPTATVLPIEIEKVGAEECSLEGTRTATGRVLAEATGSREEKVIQLFRFEPTERRNYRKWNGSPRGSRLLADAQLLKITGTIEMEVENGLAWGPY